MKKKILILGNSANTYSLAKKLSEKHEIFVAPGNNGISEFATCVDIRETSSVEILNFVLENNIDLTIPVTKAALNSNITELFEKNNEKIFASSKNSYKIIQDKAYAKKLLYRLKVPTPKFGIFEKQNLVFDYIKNQSIPFVIKTNESTSATVLTTVKSAKNLIEFAMNDKDSKIIIEDYVYGTPFVFYIITDGYKALPIGSSIIYKHSLEGDGGQLTLGMGSCTPNYKLSFANENYIMNNIVYPVLSQMESEGNPYLGILGVNGILTDNGELQILGFKSFMQDCDSAGILALIDTDIYELFESCVLGSFSDEVNFIPQTDFYNVTVALICNHKNNKENIISGISELDSATTISMSSSIYKNRYLEYEASCGVPLLLTASGRTVSSARDRVYTEIQNICFNGMSYRKDICKSPDRIYQTV